MKKEASQINDSKIDSEKEATKASNGSFENFCPAEVGLEESEIPLPKDTLSLESPESVKGGMPGVSVNSGRDLKVKIGLSRAKSKKVSPGMTGKQSSQPKMKPKSHSSLRIPEDLAVLTLGSKRFLGEVQGSRNGNLGNKN